MKLFGRVSVLGVLAFLLFKSASGFQQIAWGTGSWWGEYSLKWAVIYLFYCIACILILFFTGASLFSLRFIQPIVDEAIRFRERLGIVRWLLASILLIFPVWFLQYTPWGIVFDDLYIRLSFLFLELSGLAFLMVRGSGFMTWRGSILAVLLASSIFVITVSFSNVTDHPFSLGWSEGNRLWDYSVMFGSSRYDYPADREIPVFLDTGRQFVGGLAFLIPNLTITMERFWLGLTLIIPYLLLGLAAFRAERKDRVIYLLASVWVLIFLRQGPIHSPLVLCAAAVALIWKRPLWLAIPLIVLISYAAQASRFTWLFAPGLWIGMLELAGAELQDGKLSRTAWFRAVVLGLAGAAGGYFGPKVVGILAGNAGAEAAISVEGVSTTISTQPLLWYRLLPNATYGTGILVGFLIAVLPLVIVLFHLAFSRRWKLNVWQSLAILSPLLAFLVVGLVVSTKIGGGGDLHNMDMFLIGLLFTAVIAWEKGGKEWFANIQFAPLGLKMIVLVLFLLPGLQPFRELHYNGFVQDVSRFATLTDTLKKEKLNSFPSPEMTEGSLETIRKEVADVRAQGGVILFMDQRQLLTFGFIQGVPLVPEYDKKLLMDQALSSNADYFKDYYADLAAKKFDLIVSEILRKPVKDSSYEFGEENNAWVNWVSIPTLCYYEPKVTLPEVGIQLLVPRADTNGCSSLLPDGTTP